jgi:Arf-GAP/SH3 domain/ANK repeat/PH domain-containing protein
VAAHAKHCL